MVRIIGEATVCCQTCGKIKNIKIDEILEPISMIDCELGAERHYQLDLHQLCTDCFESLGIYHSFFEYPEGDFYDSGNGICLENADFVIRPMMKLISANEYFPVNTLNDTVYNLRQQICDMTPREFELFVGEIFKKLGYSDVRVTKPTRDGGYDLECYDDSKGTSTYIIGQCKHYSDKVGIDTIREMAFVQSEKRANQAIVITSSTFTREAKKLAADHHIALWDINDLINFLK